MSKRKLILTGCASVAAMLATVSYVHAQSAGSFYFDPAGRLVPLAQNGVPFELCNTQAGRACNLARSKVTHLHFDSDSSMSTSSSSTSSTSDGYCEVITITQDGMTYYYYDPNDPDCP